MVSFSYVNLMGHVGNDVVIKSGGKASVNYLQLSIGITKSYKKKTDGKNWTTKTHWVKVMVYGPYAMYISSRISKGDLIHITGELHVSERTKPGGFKELEMYVLCNHIVPIKAKKKLQIEDHNYGVSSEEIEEDQGDF